MRPKLITWFKKGWKVGLKPGKWRFSRSLAGRIAGFGYWLHKRARKELPEIEWLPQEEVERLAGWHRPKPRGIITNNRSL